MRFVLHGVVVLTFLLLQSCIEGDEEVWIKADGSARVEAVYRVPMMLLTEKDAKDFQESLERNVGSDANLRLVTNTITRERGQRVIRIRIETDDVSQLEGVSSDDVSTDERSKGDKILQAILGKIDVQLDGLSAELNREVDLSPLIDEYVGKNASVMLSDAEFRYVVHLPGAVEESNAHEVSEDGRTLRWTYGLGELKGETIKMNLRASVPIPWWVYGAGVVVVLMVGVMVLFLLRKFKTLGQ